MGSASASLLHITKVSFLLKKSEGNLRVAEAMVNNGDFCHSSVHCGYYACLQLIKYVLGNKLGTPVVLQAGGSTHKEAQRLMFQALGKVDRNSAINFHNDFGQLRVYRLQSDYEDVEVTVTKANLAYGIAKRVYKDIKTNFLT